MKKLILALALVLLAGTAQAGEPRCMLSAWAAYAQNHDVMQDFLQARNGGDHEYAKKLFNDNQMGSTKRASYVRVNKVDQFAGVAKVRSENKRKYVWVPQEALMCE